MKFGNKKLVGLLTAGAILLTMPVQSGASTGITAGISQKIAANIETVAGGNAGVSSALASCMDAESAGISAGDAAKTAAGASVCGYSNLGIAKVEGNLNVREAAGEDAELVGKMPGNAGCEILGVEGDWTQIQSGEVTGYVKSEQKQELMRRKYPLP